MQSEGPRRTPGTSGGIPERRSHPGDKAIRNRGSLAETKPSPPKARPLGGPRPFVPQPALQKQQQSSLEGGDIILSHHSVSYPCSRGAGAYDASSYE